MSELQTLGQDTDQEWEGEEGKKWNSFIIWCGILEIQVVTTKFHGDSALTNRNGLCHNFGDWKSKSRVLSRPRADERPRAGLDIAAPSWALTRWVEDSQCTGAYCGVFSDKDSNPLRSELHPGDLI